MPKLFINADEGHGLAGAAREHARTFKNQTEVTVHGRLGDARQKDREDDKGRQETIFSPAFTMPATPRTFIKPPRKLRTTLLIRVDIRRRVQVRLCTYNKMCAIFPGLVIIDRNFARVRTH